jgi:ketosteroid isomerase-like protein
MKTAFSTLFAALACCCLLTAADAQKDVLAALDGWRLGTIHKDTALLNKVLHKDLTYTHSSGLEQTKADNLKAVAAPRYRIVAIEFSNTTVRIFGDTAIVKTDADVTSASSGSPATSHLILLHVFVKTPEGWQMIARQATKKEAK